VDPTTCVLLRTDTGEAPRRRHVLHLASAASSRIGGPHRLLHRFAGRAKKRF
jgi:hypothetical protein